MHNRLQASAISFCCVPSTRRSSGNEQSVGRWYREWMKFDDIDLYDQLMSSADAQLEDTSFGVVAMDTDHRVVMYNRTESTLSGLSPERVVGRHFFSEVAPCTNNFMVAHRFETEDDLDATIDYVFTLRMKPTPVQLRLLKRPDAARRFLLVQWS